MAYFKSDVIIFGYLLIPLRDANGIIMAVMYKRRNKAVGLFASRNRHPQVIEFPTVCIVFVCDSALDDRKSTVRRTPTICRPSIC